MTGQYMTDPVLLESLRGQQYLVLRPVADVASFYDDEQSALRGWLPDSVSHPNTGHVTLRGFYEPHRVDELQATLTTWATAQSPVSLQVDAVDGFPPPHQIVIARLQRSTSLLTAYASLTTLLDRTDFTRVGELPLDQWIFHLSLIYAGALSERDWNQLHERARREFADGPTELVSSADFVWYDDEGEHVEVLPLRLAA